jgi:asparagine synthetase B (glutamine-hydrolysing)
MFLFSSDRTLIASAGRLLDEPQPFGRFHLKELATGVLLWAENRFTTCRYTPNAVCVEMRRPEIDGHRLTSFEWNLDRRSIQLDRDWSGIFSLRFSRKSPLIVTSHSKLSSLILKRPVSLLGLDAGSGLSAECRNNCILKLRKAARPSNPIQSRVLSYRDTINRVRQAVINSVRSNATDGAALLLSGGIDSTILAAVASRLGVRLRTFTFGLLDPPRPEQGLSSDRFCAEEAASHYGHSHRTILITRDSLLANIPLAIYLAETARGTIVDELPAHIEMARFFATQGIRCVLTGEGADDLFGAFPFALRYYRGRELQAFVRRELVRGLPDELAVLQNIYLPWGISLVHPYWTEELRRLGFSLPLRYRVDHKRLMKRVLRDAFSDLLPNHLLTRPKGVPRDCTQIRTVLGKVFGDAPNRYRPILSKMMKRRSRWPEELLHTLQNR